MNREEAIGRLNSIVTHIQDISAIKNQMSDKAREDIKALEFAINSLKADEAYDLEYEISKNSKLNEAVAFLIEKYNYAEDRGNIHKPFSWALYKTWKHFDEKEKPKAIVF